MVVSIIQYSDISSYLFGIITAVVVGLQDDGNKKWLRPIGLVPTTLGTGMATISTSFHISDNIDKLIEVRSKIVLMSNQLEHNTRNKTSDQIDEILFQYSQDYQKQMDELAKLKGSAGHLDIGNGNHSAPDDAKQPKSP